VTAERGELPLSRACELIGVSRSWYYQHPTHRPEADLALQDEIENIVTDCPAYGYRRVTRELERRGLVVNHKRVLRIMRDNSWLCRLVRNRPRTTQSDHSLPVFPNLLPATAVTALDQVWVADITYIRLQHEFIYLAVILDAYSRRVVGWNLSRRLDVSLTLLALESALQSRQIAPGVLHHSDRGVQYAAKDYVARVQAAGMVQSMSRKGQPRDNPQAESFFRTLKTEQVYLSEYLDFEDAYRQIGRFLNQVYNRERLHSKLGYRPPVEFEAAQREQEKGHPGRSTVGAPVPERPMAPAAT
jgi:transposase InsO family protein